MEPNSSLITSNIKGLLVGDLFWLYHRLSYETEVNSFIATDESQKKKINTLNSDKVHECSFKKQSGTNKYIHQESTHTHSLTHTHTHTHTSKWVRQPVNTSETKTSRVCVVMLLCRSVSVYKAVTCPVTWHTPEPTSESSDNDRRAAPGEAGSRVFTVCWINSYQSKIFIQSFRDQFSKMITNDSWNSRFINYSINKKLFWYSINCYYF